MQKTCHNPWCKQPFEITQDDLAFYDKISPTFNGKKELIPPPTLCPSCREQRRVSWRNVRTLYSRTCSATGKKIMSVHHDSVPFPVYEYDYWWSDHWDPLAYGQDFDFNRPFFEQFAALSNRAPHINLQNAGNENAYYTSYAGWNKNCYWIFYSDHNQDCCFLEDSFNCKDCLDCSYSHRCTLCYETFFCTDCYNCRFAQGCHNCTDGWFLKNCIGCRSCFGCVNLRNGEYFFFNQKCSKEEYAEKLRQFDLKATNVLARLQEQFHQYALQFPHKNQEGVLNENATGNYINNCKNVRFGFAVEHCQDCAYINDCQKCVDCYDMDGWGGTGAQLVYEGQTVGEGAMNVAFCSCTWTGASSIYYSDLCLNNCHDLFGCFGLKKMQYCILNKQYTKEEYEKLVPRIIEHMRNDGGGAAMNQSETNGSWGEFFPISISPFAYNETVAQEYFPLTKNEVEKRGWKWREEKDEMPKVSRVIPAEKLPNSIDDIPDDILNWAMKCETTKRPFKIIKQELDFYRQMKLPVPHFHPDERHKRRMAHRNPRKLWNRPCMKCGKEMETTYQPSRPEIVYCEPCYLAEVY